MVNRHFRLSTFFYLKWSNGWFHWSYSFHGVDWRGKFIGISNSIGELKYLSTPETDQLMPVSPCVSQDSHISTSQRQHEGHISEKFRGYDIL